MTATTKPAFSDDPLFRLLREGDIASFNDRRSRGEPANLAGSDLRGLDLRGIDADGLDLSNCYLRQADLRGVDFSNANLQGASINSARISGAYFPAELSAAEIQVSVQLGTRMRYSQFHHESASMAEGAWESESESERG